MLKLLENQNVQIIAHANAILDRQDIPVPFDLQKAIALKAFTCDKIIEINLKYKVPDTHFIDLLKLYQVKLCTGSDAHSLQDM
jgi:histidinol phosphatase-like PHP family hydrolase